MWAWCNNLHPSKKSESQAADFPAVFEEANYHIVNCLLDGDFWQGPEGSL